MTIGLGPRRLSLPRAYVRIGDPFRSLPHDPLCPRTMSARTTARRRRDESFCSVNRPSGHIRASDPRCFVASLALTVRRRCTRDAAASSVATSCEATRGGGLPPSLPRSRRSPVDPRHTGGALRFEVTVRTASAATFRPPPLPHESDRPRTVLLRHPRHVRMISGDGSSPASFRPSRPSPVCKTRLRIGCLPLPTTSRAGALFAPPCIGEPT
jgi:hypothetical protein